MTTTPALALQGPSQVVAGREYAFTLSDRSGGYYLEKVDVTVSSGARVYSRSIAVDEDELGVRLDRAGAQATISAQHAEIEGYNDSFMDEPRYCMRALVKTVTAISGRRMPRPAASARGGRAMFRLAYPSQCEARYAPTSLALRIKAPGAKKWVVLRASDQCNGWDKYRARGRGFRMHERGDAFQRVFFRPTGWRNAITSFQFRIKSGSRTLKRGTIRVTTTHKPALRVYAFHPDGSINDHYWNYCVNNGETVWMDHGNPYCLTSSSTRRTVAIR